MTPQYRARRLRGSARRVGLWGRAAQLQLTLIGALAAAISCACAAGSVTARSGNARSAKPLTIERCVAEWNTARLGDGHVLAKVLAADGPTEAALMFVSRDGVCGFAFDTEASLATGLGGVFVTAFGGAYDLGQDPLSGLASTFDSATAAALEGRAGRTTNIHIDLHDGTVVAERGESLESVQGDVIDRTSGCRVVQVTPSLNAWLVGRRTVNCLRMRILAWAWELGEGAALTVRSRGAAAREIAGWRCVGTDQAKDFSGPFGYKRVTCTAGAGYVALYR